MSDYDDLVKRLRQWRAGTQVMQQEREEAATALATLQAEVERLRDIAAMLVAVEDDGGRCELCYVDDGHLDDCIVLAARAALAQPTEGPPVPAADLEPNRKETASRTAQPTEGQERDRG